MCALLDERNNQTITTIMQYYCHRPSSAAGAGRARSRLAEVGRCSSRRLIRMPDVLTGIIVCHLTGFLYSSCEQIIILYRVSVFVCACEFVCVRVCLCVRVCVRVCFCALVAADYGVISATITFDQRSGVRNKNIEKIKHKRTFIHFCRFDCHCKS